MNTHPSDFGEVRTRVLVIFPGALGDLICLIPALRALGRRHRGASIELMAREALARFAVGRVGVERGHSIDRREVSLLFAESGNAAGARKFFGGFQRIYSFFATGDRGFRESLTAAAADAEVSFHPFRPDAAGHIAAAYLRALGEPSDAIESRLDLLPQDREAASRRLDAAGLSAGGFALLIPGSGSAYKNWPAPRFVELAERLRSRTPVVVVLGPAESHLEAFFAARAPAVLTGLELGELAGIAATATVFIGNDSGVSHLAGASGAPGIAIFGPTDPERWRPPGRVRVLHRRPLDALGVAEVAGPALEMLA